MALFFIFFSFIPNDLNILVGFVPHSQLWALPMVLKRKSRPGKCVLQVSVLQESNTSSSPMEVWD